MIHVLYIPVAPQEYRIRAVSFPHPEFAPVTMHVKPVKSTADTESVGEMKHLACRNSQTSVSKCIWNTNVYPSVQ